MVLRHALLNLLRGRDARSSLRQHLLLASEQVVQISLNIPGLPKTLPRDREALEETWRRWRQSGCGATPHIVAWLDNAAGKALLLAFSAEDPEKFKEAGCRCEELLPWGRVLDIDVYTFQGPLSRERWGMPPRRCFLCGEEAKVCARLGTHTTAALRRAAQNFLARARR